MCVTNTTAATPVGSADYTQRPAALIGSTQGGDTITRTPYVFPFCPTARNLIIDSTNANNMINEAQRTSTSCYMVGYKETIEIQISDGTPWQWRRIVFLARGNVGSLLSGANERLYQDASGNSPPLTDGMYRVVNAISGNRNQGSMFALFQVMFEGQNASDWTDPMTANLDRHSITVVSDRTRTLSSGNEQGMIRKYRSYIPLNKTLVYDDDEVGELTSSAYASVNTGEGMGNLYVIDFFRARYGASASAQLWFSPQGKLYWHEK